MKHVKELTVAQIAKQSAKKAGLHYVSDSSPGIRRLRHGKSFTYAKSNGSPVKDAATLARIKALVIPPAWEDVWICSSATGHLQCTGRDVKGRKQSRYHADFRATRDEAKYDKVLDFAAALPKLRRTIRRHLKLPGLPKEKVLATIVSLLEKTLIRIGNDEYAKTNNSFGLTTIRNRHAKVTGSRVRFSFKGKSGVAHDIELTSPKLAKVIKHCQELPGQELFEYVDDDGKRHDVKSNDVNAYLNEITGEHFTAKDFRTWTGTVLAAKALQEFEKFDSQAQAKKNVVAAIEKVASRLGNTKAVCRKCYVHPIILDSYLGGTLTDMLQHKAEKEMKHISQLPAEEAAVVTLLQQQLKRAKPSPTKRARPLRKSA